MKTLGKVPGLLLCALCAGLAGCTGNGGTERGTDTRRNDTARRNTGIALELVFRDSSCEFTGIAKDPTGDLLLVNYPRWSGPYRYGLAAVTDSATKRPYPDAATNDWKPGQDGRKKWVCVQSVTFDRSGTLWVLDPAAPQMKGVAGKSYKLVRVNKQTGAWEKTYSFAGVASDTSYINDVRIDVKRQFAYLTNSKEGGIVVVDLATGKMRQVLHYHYSVKSDTAYTFTMDGRELRKMGMPAKFQSDGIALTPDGDWLYYKPATDDKLYRIRTEFLRDWKRSDMALGGKVQDLGHKCASDGMDCDDKGNVYLSDMQHSRIVRIDPSAGHRMTTVVEDRRLIWPDSYSIAGGYLYVTCSQLHLQPDYNEGVSKRTTPYTVYRVRL